jgi:adenine-specific DNA-methyltransferase
LNDDELKRLKGIQGRATHSAWLTFMYPRLYLAKKLLKDSGVIFVSIDDNEQANLKLLMDDVFGEGQYWTNVKYLDTKIKKKNGNGCFSFLSRVHKMVVFWT